MNRMQGEMDRKAACLKNGHFPDAIQKETSSSIIAIAKPPQTLIALGILVTIATIQVFHSTSRSRPLAQRLLQRPTQNLVYRMGTAAHYVTLQVGSSNPPLQLKLDLDSEATAFPCNDCDETCLDKPTLFDPTASRIHKCPGECISAQSSQCDATISGRCGVHIEAYDGYEVQDQVGIFTEQHQEHSSATFPLSFHCISRMAGMTHSEDGILGMSSESLSFIRQMKNAGKIDQAQFSLCFRELPVIVVPEGTSAGSVVLGTVDRSNHKTPLVWAKNGHDQSIDSNFPVFTSYSVHVRRIYLSIGAHDDDVLTRISQSSIGLMRIDANVMAVDGMTKNIQQDEDPYAFMNGSKGSIVIQNRHVETLLHRSAESAFRAAFATVTGLNFPSSGGVQMTTHQYSHLPTIILQLQAHMSTQSVPIAIPGFIGRHDGEHPYDIVLAIPPRHYLHYEGGIAVPTLTFHDTTSRLGTHALQGHDVVFDLEHDRIGFAERSGCHQGVSLSLATGDNDGSGAEVIHVVASEGEEVVADVEWVPEDVAADKHEGSQVPKATNGSEVTQESGNGLPGEKSTRGKEDRPGDGESSLPEETAQNDKSSSATSDKTGNGLMDELDEGGASTTGGQEKGMEGKASTNGASNELPGELGDPGETDGSQPSDQEGASTSNEEFDGGKEVEKVEQHAGLPQANMGDSPPAFRVGPGVTRSRSDIGVTNTVGGNGFWNLVGFAAFFLAFFVTALATRDGRSHSQDKNYGSRRRAGARDSHTIGKVMGASTYGGKSLSKGKSVGKTTSTGKHLSDDMSLLTYDDRDDRTTKTATSASYFHCNSGYTSPASRDSPALSDVSWLRTRERDTPTQGEAREEPHASDRPEPRNSPTAERNTVRVGEVETVISDNGSKYTDVGDGSHYVRWKDAKKADEEENMLENMEEDASSQKDTNMDHSERTFPTHNSTRESFGGKQVSPILESDKSPLTIDSGFPAPWKMGEPSSPSSSSIDSEEEMQVLAAGPCHPEAASVSSDAMTERIGPTRCGTQDGFWATKDSSYEKTNAPNLSESIENANRQQSAAHSGDDTNGEEEASQSDDDSAGLTRCSTIDEFWQ